MKIALIVSMAAFFLMGFLSSSPIPNGLGKAMGAVIFIIYLIKEVFTGPAVSSDSGHSGHSSHGHSGH